MNIITYDDDCSVCTKFSKFLRPLVRRTAIVVPMHHSQIMKAGISKLGFEEYWTSFHVVVEGEWFSEKEAIVRLAGLLPMGIVLQKVASFPPILDLLTKLLRHFQRRRKLECKATGSGDLQVSANSIT
ncbi:MAG: DUF393 domain-containing protein [Methanobacteriota archaeon]|nr:MAG: DUF393 domain-containing protein [Euryarchaeota archaeon]